MALLSLSMKRHAADFLDIPRSPPQSPPAATVAFSPTSASGSRIDAGFRLPFPALPSTVAPSMSERTAKKPRKQERPSLFVVERRSEDDGDYESNEDEPEEEIDDVIKPRLDAAQLPNNSAVGDLRLDYQSIWNNSQMLQQLQRGLGGLIPGAAGLASFFGGSVVREGSDKENEKSPVPVDDQDGDADYASSPSGKVTSGGGGGSGGGVPEERSAAIRRGTADSPSSRGSLFQHQFEPPLLPVGFPTGSVRSLMMQDAGQTGSDDGEGLDDGDGAPETCPECKKVFKRRVYLQRHMAREHWSTAKVFKCDKCAYETKHQSNLLVHRRTHTGERPYHCGACGQRYTQGHLLKAHIRSRHGSEMAYYNMDKRSDGVRCRRSLASAIRLDPAGASSGLLNGTGGGSGVKEDKIRFLLEAAEAARHRAAGAAAAAAAAAASPAGMPGSGPFGAMSLGQYMSALSSCLPGGAAGNMRPLLWSTSIGGPAGSLLGGPTPQSGAVQFQLPHGSDGGLNAHAAMMSTLAAAPLPAMNAESQPQRIPTTSDSSILTSLLASYVAAGNAAAASFKPDPAYSQRNDSPLQCPTSDAPAIPQDLTIGTRNHRSTPSKNAGQLSSSNSALSPASPYGRVASPMFSDVGSPARQRNLGPSKLLDEVDSRPGSNQWANSSSWSPQHLATNGEDEATDLSAHAQARSTPVDGITVSEVQSKKEVGMKVEELGLRCSSGRGKADMVEGESNDRASRSLSTSEICFDLSTSPTALRKDSYSACCKDTMSDCPHLRKLRELRRNVYRMLSVFTPYLDVAGAGISDVEADAVDDFLHEVIYSSKLDTE